MKKNYITFTLSLLFTTSVIAQPRIAAQADIGGTGDDHLVTMCRGTDGALLAAGYSNSNNSIYKSQDSKGDYDFWIVKSVYDKTTGKVVEQWDKTIGRNARDELTAAVPTRDGGYLLGGNSRDISDSAQGRYDIWIVKIDIGGNIIWDSTIGSGHTDDLLFFMDTTNDGGAILITQNYVDGLGYTAPVEDIIKLDGNGHTLWNKPMLDTGSTYVSYQSVHQTTDGGYVFAGYAIYHFDTSRFHNHVYQNAIIKTDANLNEAWRTYFGDRGGKIEARELREGGYILFSNRPTEGLYDDETGHTIPIEYYFSILKTDHSGNIVWGTREYSGFYSSDNIAFEELSNGGFLYSYIYNEEPNYWYDYLVKKIDNNGHFQWVDSIKTNGGSQIKDIKEIKPGIYVYGSYTYADIGADKTKKRLDSNNIYSDYWFVVAKDTSVIHTPIIAQKFAVPLKEPETFTVYPNPARKQLYIQLKGEAIISVLDANGKAVIQQAIQHRGVINIQQLAAGMYYLKNNSNGSTKRVIIVK